MKNMIIICLLLLGSCAKKAKYIEVENKVYDIPVKSQIVIRLVLKDSITRQNISEILEKEFRWEKDRSMKYNNPATHIFIYLYADSTDWKKNGGAWLGMKSRIANEDNPVQFSDSLN